jgi:hypothetical protein
MMKTSWRKGKVQDAHWTDIDLTFGHIIIRNWIEGGRSRFEVKCTHEEFLKGELQSTIESDFGKEVLKEIIAAVKEAPSHPPFQEEKEKMLIRKFFIESIPKANNLRGLDKSEYTINGMDNLGTVKTGLKSNKVTLYDTKTETYLKDAKGKKVPVQLKGILQSVVHLADFFYIVHTDNFCVISPEGEIVFDTYSYKLAPNLPLNYQNRLFNYFFSFRNVYRFKDIIFVKYYWDMNLYKPGLIRYELRKGFTGRWGD